MVTNSKIALENLTVSGMNSSAPLVRHLHALIQNMVQHRRSCGVDAELDYSKRISNDEVMCDPNALDYEKQIAQAIDGVTSGKRDDAIAIHTDIVIGQLNKLFKIDPTPVPDLPKREEDVVVDKIEELLAARTQSNIQEAMLGYMEQAASQDVIITEEQALADVKASNIPTSPSKEEIFDIAKKMKGAATKVIRKRAITGAKHMEREIHDILVETNYGDELLKFIDDYDTYDTAYMRIGSHLPFSRKVWKGNKWQVEDQDLPVAKRISPHNFYWSSDSLEINDGTAVGDVLYLRRIDLERMYQFEENDHIKKSIKTAVEMCSSFESKRTWLETVGHDNENDKEDYSGWVSGTTVPLFRLSLLIDACTLRELGLNPTGELSQYECEAWILDEYIVRFKVFDPKGYSRPYVKSSFRNLPSKFHGKSLPSILKPLEHEIRSVKRNEMLNIGFSSMPITLRDVMAFQDDGELPDVVQPGDNYDVEGYVGKNIKPIEFVTMTNITNTLRQVQFDLQAEADVKSKIPRILTGQGSLGSSIRSASMLATQINGASKNLKHQIMMISRQVIIPHIEVIFEHLMRYSDNNKAKVDAEVNIGSIESLINREYTLNAAKELVQYLAPYAGQGMISPKVIEQILFKIMSDSGISTEDDPELAEEFNNLADDTLSSNPQQSGVRLDGRSDFQALTGQ